MHEHILNDCRCWWHRPTEPERQHLADRARAPGILGELRHGPVRQPRQCALDDEPLAIAELLAFKHAGRRAPWSIPPAAASAATRRPCSGSREPPGSTSSWAPATTCRARTRPSSPACRPTPSPTRSWPRRSTASTAARIGLIGEIGVSSDFTPDEEKSLRGAARAQARTGLPLMVHLPGWFRLGHRVLDIVEEEGGDPAPHRALPHEPVPRRPRLPDGLAARGAFIEYDMIGMDYFYADQQVQCPSRRGGRPRAIARLVDAGFGRPAAALAGRVPEDDADPPWRLRLRLCRCATSCRACGATASTEAAIRAMLIDNPARRVRAPEPDEGPSMPSKKRPARRRELGERRDPLQGLRPVRLGHLPPRRRAAGQGAGGQRLRPALHAGARGGDRVPADHGRPGRLRRGHALRHRLEHAPAAPRRLAAAASPCPTA